MSDKNNDKNSDKKKDPFLSGIGIALSVDLPFILDSLWRRSEFEANRLFDYKIEPDLSGAEVTRRSDRHLPVFWMFIATLVFFTYGPTFDALCSIVGATGMPLLRYAVGAGIFLLTIRQALHWWHLGHARANKRIKREGIEKTWRAVAIQVCVLIGVAALMVPLVLLGSYHITHAKQTGCVATSASPALLQVTVLAVAILCAVWRATCKLSPWRRTVEQTLLLAITGALLLMIAPSGATEAMQGPYPHVYGALALVLAAIASIAPWIARRRFRSLLDVDAQGFRDSLHTVELFPKPRVSLEISWRRAIAAWAVGSLSHPLHLLLLPAFFVLMVPTRWMWETFYAALFASSLLLMVGNLSSRWGQMVLYVKRWFLIGTPLVVSIVVIVMAGLRLDQVQYASTVLDAAPFGAIFMWVAMAYALFWWFEYSINSAASFALLRVLGTETQARREVIEYLIEKPYAGGVEITGRYIAPHGAGRFAAMGWLHDEVTKEPEAAFHTYELIELFRRLMPAGKEDVLHDINRRLQLYFLLVNALVVTSAVAYWNYYGYGDDHNTVAAVVTAQTPPATAQYSDLAKMLAEQASQHRPAIVVAASGGGTRAALFTASALEGLSKLGVAQDVVLLSGVSGGGVASAYFFAHYRSLIGSSPSAWRLYKNRMTEPFIEDVLDGAGEWRLVSAEPLGNLLAESFDRRLFADGLQHIGDATRPALILNTTITGHPQEQSFFLRGMFASVATNDCDQLHRPYSFLAGGRLVFTNLKENDAFPSDTSLLSDVRFPYVVLRDPQVSLARAAALNANFPPVFTNARVNVAVNDAQCPTRAYYVTDGGATENLGLVSSLYALRAALRELPLESRPVIHIVAIEASATGYDYSQDRGLSAAADGAKERLVGGLAQQLLADVCTQAGDVNCKGPQLQLHYLSMPLAFRSRGGFGTHWMFPNSIDIENPRVAALPAGVEKMTNLFVKHPRLSVSIYRTDLMDLWTALHEPDAAFCGATFARKQQQIVANWICGKQEPPLPADLYIAQWQNLVQSMQPKVQ